MPFNEVIKEAFLKTEAIHLSSKLQRVNNTSNFKNHLTFIIKNALTLCSSELPYSLRTNKN